MRLHYTQSGHVLISPGDDLDTLVDALLDTGYSEEFCIALDFDPFFIARLMAAGFLVMSAALEDEDDMVILLPKLHLIRSVLFFPELRVTKSVKPKLKHYELRVDTDFDRIMERCVEIHGRGWLTEDLTNSIRLIRSLGKRCPVRPVSFGVYRDGDLKAGEFGIRTGRVYTSYSGYYDEDSAGTVQLVLTTRYLRDQGFAFFDLGMPWEYKERLGATNIDPRRFVELFRSACSAHAELAYLKKV
jgi:Leu/Phe-tRNA-protein transferase